MTFNKSRRIVSYKKRKQKYARVSLSISVLNSASENRNCQSIFTCSTSRIEILEEIAKYFQS